MGPTRRGSTLDLAQARAIAGRATHLTDVASGIGSDESAVS